MKKELDSKSRIDLGQMKCTTMQQKNATEHEIRQKELTSKDHELKRKTWKQCKDLAKEKNIY